MDDERLRHQRFHEPSRPEKGGVRGIPAIEHVQHDEVSRVIEDRADRPDVQDEFLQLVHGPGTRPRYLFRIDVISRDRHLGEVVQQVV